MCFWRNKIHSDTNEIGRINNEDTKGIENATPQRNHNEEAIKWRDVSSAIDFFAFWILMGTDLIITLFIFIHISVNKSII